jgi:hypothetical protein
MAWAVGYDLVSFSGHGLRGVSSVNMATGSVSALSRKPLHLAHGALNYVAWGVLLPTGVLLARFAKDVPLRQVGARPLPGLIASLALRVRLCEPPSRS